MRHELAVLRTDYETLTRSLEELTFQAFADIKKSSGEESTPENSSLSRLTKTSNITPESHKEEIKRSFGSLRTVDEDSVCGRSGLMDCDRILSFGEITYRTYRGLREFGEYVASCRGKTIEVEVERDRVGGIERLKVVLAVPREGNLGLECGSGLTIEYTSSLINSPIYHVMTLFFGNRLCTICLT